MRLYFLIEEKPQDTQFKKKPRFGTYRNKKSKMNESILIHYTPELGTVSIHVYAFIIPENYLRSKAEVIDLRKHYNKFLKSSPLRIVGQVKTGSLSFIRYFIENPLEKKYEQKLKQKYPNKKNIRKKSFPPLLLFIAHYCNQFNLPQNSATNDFSEKMQEIANQFDELIQEEIHPTLRTIGKPLYLKGETNLINFHQTREFPEVLVKRLAEEKMIQSINKQKQYSILVPGVKGLRKETNEQDSLYQEKINTLAISHIINIDDKLLPLNNDRFPLVVVGEPKIRRNLILNILNNANARFMIFDPKENYGRLALRNPRIRGYVLNKNYFLDILCSEGEKISKQVYAYWFAKIIAYITNIRDDLIKLIEANLLRAYFDEHNQTLEEYTYHRFATGELTSEGSNSRRSDLSNTQNALYTLSTYREISHKTMIGNSPIFESLFDTKGTLIQFTNYDDQLTKTAYLFTLLKLRSVTNDDPKILVLENLDDIIGQNGKAYQNNHLSDLISGLFEDYFVIIGVRSPSKITELFKNTKSKFINRLLTINDRNLLFNEYKISNDDTSKTSKLTGQEFLVLVPEFSTPNYIKIDPLPDTKMPIIISEGEEKNTERKLQIKIYTIYDDIAPEIQKIIFNLICLLREKSNKAIPEEGLDKIITDCSKADLLRAKEIALGESFLKKVVSSPNDSYEKLNWLQLTERGEEFYKGYLNLQEKIPRISFSSLRVEKNFERKILENLEKAQQFIKDDDNNAAVNIMIDIVANMLGAFPEDDQFIKGKPASEILNHWYYLKQLQDSNEFISVKRIFNKFQSIIVKSLKTLKHNFIDNLTKEGSPEQINKKQIKNDMIDKENDSEYEFNIPLSTNVKQSIKEVENSPLIDETDINDEELLSESSDESNSSLFKKAIADLKTAGLSHLDTNGDLYKPEKGTIFDDDFFENENDLESFDYNPFESEEATEENSVSNFKKQKAQLDSLKNKLMLVIAKKLAVTEIDDEPFIWHVLKNRFNGKLDDGYTISELVSTMIDLYEDIENGALINDKKITKLNKLIYAKKLMPEQLVLDLKQYIADNNQ